MKRSMTCEQEFTDLSSPLPSLTGRQCTVGLLIKKADQNTSNEHSHQQTKRICKFQPIHTYTARINLKSITRGPNYMSKSSSGQSTPEPLAFLPQSPNIKRLSANWLPKYTPRLRSICSTAEVASTRFPPPKTYSCAVYHCTAILFRESSRGSGHRLCSKHDKMLRESCKRVHQGWYCEYENAVGQTPLNYVVHEGRMLYPSEIEFGDGEWLVVRQEGSPDLERWVDDD